MRLQPIPIRELKQYSQQDNKLHELLTNELSARKHYGTKKRNFTDSMLGSGCWYGMKPPQKFESKWFGPYQVVEKMMLGTYRLQDPNGKELATLVHGNRLIKANISSADELRRLWAAPAMKDQLRRRNLNAEIMPSDERQNTELLEQYLWDDDTDDVVQAEEELE